VIKCNEQGKKKRRDKRRAEEKATKVEQVREHNQA
jgi:hypothetical protein